MKKAVLAVMLLLLSGILVPLQAQDQGWFELSKTTLGKIGNDGQLCIIDISNRVKKLELWQEAPDSGNSECLVIWRSGKIFVAGRRDPLFVSFQENCYPAPIHLKIGQY